MRAGDRGERDPALAAGHRDAQLLGRRLRQRPRRRSSAVDSPSAAASAALAANLSVGGADFVGAFGRSLGRLRSAVGASAAGFLGGRLRRPELRSAARGFFGGCRLGSGASSPAAASAAASSATALPRRRLVGGFGSAASASARRLPRQPRRAGSSAGASAAASAASAAFFARSSTRSLAFSPGSAFFGLLRAGALADAGGIEEAQHAVRRLGADAQPMRDAVGVELHALGRILRQQRVVGADLLDEAAVARRCGCRRRRCGNKGASWRRRGRDELQLPFITSFQ